MKTASITEAKNNLSALIDSLKSGGAVLILDRGRPVARLEPAGGRDGGTDERLARLIREGLARPPRSALPRAFFTEPLARLKPGASAVAAVLREREEGW